MTARKRHRAGIYVRVSLDRDGTSESPSRQRSDCAEVAERKGLEVVDVYEDRDRSAYTRRGKRPEFERLLADLDRGVIDTVIFWKLDRLTRQGLTGLHPLLSAGANLVSVHEQIDTTSAMGRGVAGLLASIAEQESENTSLRVKRAHRAAAERGQMHSGGPRPYGYSKEGEVVPAEAAVIREAANRALSGESFRSIATDLNARGVRTSTGGEWHSSVLANLLRSPRLVALREHNGTLHEGRWPAILSISEHQRLVETKSEPRAFRKPYHLLAGLIYCSECGGKMKTMGFRMKNGRIFERYQCVKTPGQVNCGHVAITKASTDEHAKNEIFAALSAGHLVPPGDDKLDEAELLRDLDEDRRRLNELSGLFGDGAITKDEWLTARGRVEERVIKNEARLDDLRSERDRVDAVATLQPGSRDDLEAWWEAADDHQRRDAVHAALNKVVVQPAKRRGGNVYDPTRVALHFRWPLLQKIAEQADAKPHLEPEQRTSG